MISSKQEAADKNQIGLTQLQLLFSNDALLYLVRMLIFVLLTAQLLSTSTANSKPPNVLFIVADDLGE